MDQPDCRRCSIRDNCVRLRLSVALTWEILNLSFLQLLSHRPPVWLFLKPSAPFTSHDAHKLTAFTALYLHTLVREVAIMPPCWRQPWSFWVFHPSICLSVRMQKQTSVCLDAGREFPQILHKSATYIHIDYELAWLDWVDMVKVQRSGSQIMFLPLLQNTFYKFLLTPPKSSPYASLDRHGCSSTTGWQRQTPTRW